MNHFLHFVGTSIALLTAPMLLLAHVWWRPRKFWLTYFLVSICAVWIGGSLSTYFYHQSLWIEIQQYNARGIAPPEELSKDWASDTSVAMMPILGWIPGIMHAIVCAIAYLILNWTYKLIIKISGPPKPRIF